MLMLELRALLSRAREHQHEVGRLGVREQMVELAGWWLPAGNGGLQGLMMNSGESSSLVLSIDG